MITTALNPASGLTADRLPYALSGARLGDTSAAWDGTALYPALAARTLGKSGSPWANSFLTAARFGNGSFGPTLTTSGTSPNESLLLTAPTSGVISVPGSGVLISGNSRYGLQVGSALIGTDGGDGTAVFGSVQTGMNFWIQSVKMLSLVGTANLAITGGPGNLTICAGTGNSRAMALQTTTAGGVATTALTLDASQNATVAGYISGTTGLRVNGIERINTTRPVWTNGANPTLRDFTGAATAGDALALLETLMRDLRSIGILA